MRKLILILIATILISGCSYYNNSNSSSIEEVIQKNINNDIFMFTGRVYKRAEDIDWVQKIKLTPKQHIGTISGKYNNGIKYEEEMATQLPIGAKIYSTVEKEGPLLIVIVNGKTLKYLAIMEG